MFKVSLTGLNGVKAQFVSASEKIKKDVAIELEAMAQNWVIAAKRDAPVDQGTLKALISYSSSLIAGNPSVNIVSGAFYSPFMEFGTKGNYKEIPGTEQIAAQFRGISNGDFMQLFRMIVRWVRRKGISGVYSVKTRKRLGSKINQFAEDYKVAWPIVMSILKNGVKPHPYFFKQKDTEWPKMIRNVEARIRRDSKVAVILPGDIRRPQIITI